MEVKAYRRSQSCQRFWYQDEPQAGSENGLKGDKLVESRKEGTDIRMTRGQMLGNHQLDFFIFLSNLMPLVRVIPTSVARIVGYFLASASLLPLHLSTFSALILAIAR